MRKRIHLHGSAHSTIPLKTKNKIDLLLFYRFSQSDFENVEKTFHFTTNISIHGSIYTGHIFKFYEVLFCTDSKGLFCLQGYNKPLFIFTTVIRCFRLPL